MGQEGVNVKQSAGLTIPKTGVRDLGQDPSYRPLLKRALPPRFCYSAHY